MSLLPLLPPLGIYYSKNLQGQGSLNVWLLQEHETVVETEQERRASGKPVGSAFYPLAGEKQPPCSQL